MNKTLLVILLRWVIPGLLAVAFLFLPDLYVERASSPLASNWLARIFFAVYLINPFVGAARAVEDDNKVIKDFEKYQFFSGGKDTLSTMTYLNAIFTVLSTSIVLLLGMKVFFPGLGILSYVFLLSYSGAVIGIALYGLRLYKAK